jgi:hypothetical protein
MLLSLLSLLLFTVGSFAQGECEVCTELLNKIKADVDVSKMAESEAAIGAFCEKARDGTEERRLCYSIETMKREVSKPWSQGLPSDAVCKRLAKRDEDICSIKRVEKLDLTTFDFAKARVKQLKRILMDNDLECKGCSEKQQYIDVIKSNLLPKSDL